MSHQRKEVPIEQRETHAYRSRTDPPQYIVIASLTDTWNGPGEVFEEDGIVYERTDHIEIDVTQSPDHVRDSLAEATLDLLKNILRKPGGREMLDKLKERRREKQETEEKGK